MRAGVLPPAQGKADEPENEEYDGRDPQEMDGETEAEEEQDEQEREKKQHRNLLVSDLVW
jgi:hypothetical protein